MLSLRYLKQKERPGNHCRVFLWVPRPLACLSPSLSFEVFLFIYIFLSWERKWQHIPVFFPGGFYVDRGAWRAVVHGVAKSWTWLSNWHVHFLSSYLSISPRGVKLYLTEGQGRGVFIPYLVLPQYQKSPGTYRPSLLSHLVIGSQRGQCSPEIMVTPSSLASLPAPWLCLCSALWFWIHPPEFEILPAWFEQAFSSFLPLASSWPEHSEFPASQRPTKAASWGQELYLCLPGWRLYPLAGRLLCSHVESPFF